MKRDTVNTVKYDLCLAVRYCWLIGNNQLKNTLYKFPLFVVKNDRVDDNASVFRRLFNNKSFIS